MSKVLDSWPAQSRGKQPTAPGKYDHILDGRIHEVTPEEFGAPSVRVLASRLASIARTRRLKYRLQQSVKTRTITVQVLRGGETDLQRLIRVANEGPGGPAPYAPFVACPECKGSGISSDISSGAGCGTGCGYCNGAGTVEACARCGGGKPRGQSCPCFDNGSQ